MLHAVIIGIDKYEDPLIPDLRFAALDAGALASMCEESGHTAEIAVHLLTDERASRRRILDVVGTELAQAATPADVVLFYFAGHGSPETARGVTTASRFLACCDTERGSLFATAIDVRSDLVRSAERLRAGLVIFILDACFSGHSGGRGFIGPVLDSYRREHRAGLRLSGLNLGSGVAYLAAATDNEVAWEDERLGHGIFSFHIFEQLKGAGEAGAVGIATLYDRVYTEVRSFSRNRQHPVMWGTVTGAKLPLLGRW
jgi:uncharacterized caspase-like protein